jgi:PTS system N-acetylgalactosamine-specific IID component
MVVVGTGVYKDTNEAYPLDKKILRTVALRSLLGSGSMNSETGESFGWAWAMMPALKKIHTDEEDLSLCLGHHLEKVNAASPLTTLTMGVVLALEQQKADPETIRSIRTAMSAAADGLGLSMFRYLLIPVLALLCSQTASQGNTLGAVLMIVIPAVIAIALRLVMINIGYGKGVRAAESLIRHKEALNHAARIAGLFMLGALAVILSQALPASASFATALNGTVKTSAMADQLMPGIAGLSAVGIAYYMLAKKNRPLIAVVIVMILIGLIGAALGFWSPSAVFAAPWLNI